MKKIEHVFSEQRTPISFVIRCSCGWVTTITRRQNALARAQKIKGAMSTHLKQVERTDGARRHDR